MKLNPKIAWGLAWAGLAVVVAVPAVDVVAGRGAPESAAVLAPAPAKPAAAEAAPVKTASVTTTRTATGVIITPAGSTPPADPVAAFVKSGKALPDYISGEAPPVTAATAAPPAAPTQVASVGPAPTAAAPKPFPRPLFAAAPRAPAPAPASDPVVIVDETAVTGSVGGPAAGPRPPAPIIDDSVNWETESLRQYLERRGILEGDSPGTRSSATVTQRPGGDYDPNGFYLSDGPNNDRLERQRRLYQLFEDSGASEDFTLF